MRRKGTFQVITKTKRCIALALILASALSCVTLLQSCQLPEKPVEITPEISETPPSASPVSAEPVRAPGEPGPFVVRYVPDSAVNPITCLNRDNIVLSSLLYESLFTLDSSLNASPVLCESWSTEDNITYTFKLHPDIAMSDGTFLTAEDVVYTLKQASQKGRFIRRLSSVKSVETDEELSVTIVLNSANARFIQLLDIPIIKYASIDARIPPGSGPYIFAASGELLLVRYIRYRFYDDLPITSIQLLECDDDEIAELFDSGTLSLLLDDPADTFDIILNRQNEMRTYDTTALQYIGFNARSVVLKDADVRRAIGSSIDRAYIINDIVPGQSLAAPLALSPAYRLYDKKWEEMVVDPFREMSALLIRAGIKDFDNDSFLEYPNSSGGYYKISLDFIVNTENKYKTRAAHKIADTLRLYGFEIVVRELPWESFLNALETGTFDLYYGEVVLGADFDLSPLLLPGSYLNYGATGNNIYRPLVDSFLSARNDHDEKAAAEALCDEINLSAPFVPILYKRYVVFTPIGAVAGADPSQSAVFNHFSDWSIDLTMLP